VEQASGAGDPSKALHTTRLIAGLGNPGPRYAKNRHNVGFQVLDRLAQKHQLVFRRMEAQALLACGEVEGRRVVLLKPVTYMNRSGIAIKPAVQQHHLSLSDVLIVYDELDLPLGKIRIRERGGAAGHRGMESVIATLGTEEIGRLRIGIGRPSGQAPEEFVLEDFSPQEWIAMEEGYDRAIAALECFVLEGVAAAMNNYN
jgi:PTH1 family peptidyl-tRNA hydrolase